MIKDGILQQVGTPEELYDRPGNVFVAGFIGSPAMNFFDAAVTGSPEAMQMETAAFTVDVPPDKAGQLAPYLGKQIIFGIRPENIHDREFQPAHIRAAPVQAHVDVTEPMGNETFLYLLAAGKQFLARVDPRTRARPCQEIQLAFDMDKMHAFNPESELAIGAEPAEVKAATAEPASTTPSSGEP